MIDFKDICKSYGGRDLLDHVTLRINSGDRVGIVGPNGAGKSTLFGIITGSVSPDKGSVATPKNLRLGMLAQNVPNCDLGRSLVEFTADAVSELRTITEELHALEKQLNEGGAVGDELASLLKRHGELQTKAEHLGVYRLKPAAEQALSNLGFPVEDFLKPLKSFSGGWRMRAALARVLISEPDILMLDEPSNYLDIPAVEWLCKFLKSFPGTLLLISHDRFLLRKLAGIIVEVNNGQVTRYPGNYDYYCREREARRKNLEAAKRNSDRKREHMERVIDRFRAKATKAAQAKSWQKQLDKMEEIDLPDELGYSGAIRFPEPPPGGTEAARIENLSFSYSTEHEIFRDINLNIDCGDKLAFIGFNGTGKTTLLKLLVGRLQPASGAVVLGHHCVIGYQAQEFAELLAPEQTVYDVVRGALPAGAPTADLMNVLGSFGFPGDDSAKPCKVLSGGEKIRLLFARIFVNPPNFLVLDEPTTHLDIAARELLQEALRQYKGTVCLVSHDIEFVRNVATGIIAMEPPGIRKYFGNYDYYLEKSENLHAVNIEDNVQKELKKHDAPGKNQSADKPQNDDSGATAKERRRARAQARDQLFAAKRQAEMAVKDNEAQLERLEKRQAELVEQMSNPDNADLAAVSRELADIQRKIEITMSCWEQASLELEEILRKNAEINA